MCLLAAGKRGLQSMQRHAVAALAGAGGPHLCDLPALVVATYERYSVWVAHLQSTQTGPYLNFCTADKWAAAGTHLECKQQQECLDTVEASVHKVTHEEVVGLQGRQAKGTP